MPLYLKVVLCITVAILYWVLTEAERKTRGPGSWVVDRTLLRAQGALLCAAFYVILT